VEFELLIAIVLLALSGGGCDLGAQELGHCISGSISGDNVTLDGSYTSPGDNGNKSDDAWSEGSTVNVDGGDNDGDPNTFCMDRVGELICWSVTPPAEAGVAPVTLADIAQFRPEVGTRAMEPSGWTTVGLPTNFVSAASVHSVDGTLLGGPASVRFTPVAWHWDYGDGSQATLASGGRLWRELGGTEFSPTPTSHAFTRTGTYSVALTIEFRTEYRVGSAGWTSIAGTLPVTAEPLEVTVVRATTVLVDEACPDRPHLSGCR